MTGPHFIHANALIIGDAGILLRGPSRSGKSTLTRELVALARARGAFGRLVGDDRVSVEARDGRVVARPHPRIAGLIEARGEGVVAMPYAPACALRLVVDLTPRNRELERERAAAESSVEIAGVELPRLLENAFPEGAAKRILQQFHLLVTN